MANTVIEPSVTAKEFRLSTECKNTLTGKGDLYVGTGVKNSQDINNHAYETDRLAGPVDTSSGAVANKVLKQTNTDGTIGWGQITNNYIEDKTISNDKLTSPNIEGDNPNQVLLQSTDNNVVWGQVGTNYIAERAVTNDKMGFHLYEHFINIYRTVGSGQSPNLKVNFSIINTDSTLYYTFSDLVNLLRHDTSTPHPCCGYNTTYNYIYNGITSIPASGGTGDQLAFIVSNTTDAVKSDKYLTYDLSMQCAMMQIF